MRSLRLRSSERELPVGKILCLGRNYAEHAKEMGSELPSNPVVFLKPSSALIRDGEDIVFPPFSREMHHEVELVVGISKGGKSIPARDAMQHILGYGVGLDMTLRDLQHEAKSKGLPWTVAKGFDTSAAVSDLIPSENITDPYDLTIRCSVNGIERQNCSTAKMIFKIDRVIEYLSTIFTLEPGDLIFTGTPEGVGPVQVGDTIEAELVGQTRIRHQVKAG